MVSMLTTANFSGNIVKLDKLRIYNIGKLETLKSLISWKHHLAEVKVYIMANHPNSIKPRLEIR